RSQGAGIIAARTGMVLPLGDIVQRTVGGMQQWRDAFHLLAQLLELLPRAGPLTHPAFQIRLAGAPQVQLGVELAAQPLDVQQGLLQQDQLGLYFHIEPTGGLEQAQQQLTEGDVLERAFEDGLADAADGRLEFVDPGLRRYPAGVDVQLGDPAVIPLEERHQVARQIRLVFRSEAADDTEVDGNVFRLLRMFMGNEDVARVHVGMEETVTEYLGEEHLHAALGQLLHVGALCLQRIDIGHRNADDSLHDQYLVPAPVPVDLRNVQYLRVLEVAPQQGSVGGLAIEVQLVEDRLFVIAHHFHRAQPAAFPGYPLQRAGGQVQPLDILMDDVFDARAHHLHHHFTAIVQAGGMHLCYRGRRQRCLGKLGEGVFYGDAQLLLDPPARQFGRERWNLVLQEGQLGGNVIRQQVAPGGKDLTELDEYRAQILERQPQPGAARQSPGRRVELPWADQQQPHVPGQRQGSEDLVQAVAGE